MRSVSSCLAVLFFFMGTVADAQYMPRRIKPTVLVRGEMPLTFRFVKELPPAIPPTDRWIKIWGEFNVCRSDFEFRGVEAKKITTLALMLATDVCPADKPGTLRVQYAFYADPGDEHGESSIVRYRIIFRDESFGEVLYWAPTGKSDISFHFFSPGVWGLASGENYRHQEAQAVVSWLRTLHQSFLDRLAENPARW